MASPRTFVSFEGRTAYGERSTIPFHVTSADWQESDRVLAGIMTAFGSRHDGGRRRRQRRVRWRDADGLQAAAHRRALPRRRMRAWDVTWGRASGDLVIEDSYVSLTNARVTGGIGAHRDRRPVLARLPAQGRRRGDQRAHPRRQAGRSRTCATRSQLDDWPLDGTMSGEFHLYGRYETPVRLRPAADRRRNRVRRTVRDGATARCGSRAPACASTASKPQGRRPMTGAAYVGWDGTYSFNFDGDADAGRDAERAELPAGAAVGTARLHRRRQRHVRVAALRRAR